MTLRKIMDFFENHLDDDLNFNIINIGGMECPVTNIDLGYIFEENVRPSITLSIEEYIE